MKNKLIVLEGIDGVGKSTLCNSIKAALVKKGIRTVLYEDIEDTRHGFNQIKPFIKAEVRPVSICSSFFFYLSSAIYKSVVIKEMLNETWVICDRYIYSTLADHVVAGIQRDLIPDIKKLGLIEPDFSFWICVDDDVRLSRTSKRKVVTDDDLIPSVRGSRPYKLQLELKKMGLIKILNNGDLLSAQASILHTIFD